MHAEGPGATSSGLTGQRVGMPHAPVLCRLVVRPATRHKTPGTRIGTLSVSVSESCRVSPYRNARIRRYRAGCQAFARRCRLACARQGSRGRRLVPLVRRAARPRGALHGRSRCQCRRTRGRGGFHGKAGTPFRHVVMARRQVRAGRPFSKALATWSKDGRRDGLAVARRVSRSEAGAARPHCEPPPRTIPSRRGSAPPASLAPPGVVVRMMVPIPLA